MAVITLNSRTQRTYDLAQKNLYIGFGQTSAWSNENIPDAPDPSDTLLDELNFIARVENIKYVKPDPGGSIVYRDTNWLEVAEENIFTENIINLYLDVLLDYDNYPLISFRAIGLLENPTWMNVDIETDCTEQEYDVGDLHSQGVLHYIDNRLVTHRSISQKEKVSIILEF